MVGPRGALALLLVGVLVGMIVTAELLTRSGVCP